MSLHASFVNILLVGMTINLSACAIGPELDLTIHESERGAVYLERIPDRSFQAAHPIRLSTETMAHILRGVLVKDNQGLLQGLIAGKPAAVRAFGDQEVAYLAPLLVDGLAKAASDQHVGFHLVQVGSPTYSQSTSAGVVSSEPSLRIAPAESTKGSLYAYGRSIYFTLTEYRHRPERPDTINMTNRRLPDSTGLANRTVEFTPESAKRPDSYRHPRSLPSTLAIDYDALAGMPATQEVRPAAGPSPDAPAKAAPVQRETEMEALRKELQDIKKKLAEQEAERTRSITPAKPTP